MSRDFQINGTTVVTFLEMGDSVCHYCGKPESTGCGIRKVRVSKEEAGPEAEKDWRGWYVWETCAGKLA